MGHWPIEENGSRILTLSWLGWLVGLLPEESNDFSSLPLLRWRVLYCEWNTSGISWEGRNPVNTGTIYLPTGCSPSTVECQSFERFGGTKCDRMALRPAALVRPPYYLFDFRGGPKCWAGSPSIDSARPLELSDFKVPPSQKKIKHAKPSVGFQRRAFGAPFGSLLARDKMLHPPDEFGGSYSGLATPGICIPSLRFFLACTSLVPWTRYPR